MLKSTKFIATAVISGALILGGGAAFTASNDLPPSVAGYGESTVSGATVSSINYTLDSQDASRLASVVFTAVNQFDSNNNPVAELTLKDASELVESDPCVVSTASNVTTITCVTRAAPLISSFDETGLTVLGP